MNKKLISLLLCVLMVVTSVSCLFTFSAAAEETAANDFVAKKELFSYGDVEGFMGANRPTKVDSPQSALLSAVNPGWMHKWVRPSGGTGINTDLNSDKASLWSTESDETFPSYFGPNSQVVVDPTNPNNTALRVVQTLQQYVDYEDVKTGNTYTLSFDYINRALSTTPDKVNGIDLYFSTPIGNEGKVGVNFTAPFTFDKFEVVSQSDPNANVILYEKNNAILHLAFGTKCNDSWQNIKINFTLGAEDTSKYVLGMEDRLICFAFVQTVSSTYENVNVNGTDISVDDHAMYYDNLSLTKEHKVVDDAVFYNADGEIVRSGEYAKVNVEGDVAIGKTVTLSVDYDKTNKATRFLGWYNGDVRYSTNEQITVTLKATDCYVPRFGTLNILAEAGSYENNFALGQDMNYVVTTPSSGEPIYGDGVNWSWNFNGGYITANPTSGKYDQGSFEGVIYTKTGAATAVARSLSVNARESLTTGYPAKITNDAHTGSNAVVLNTAVARALEIKVVPGKNYTLSGYFKCAGSVTVSLVTSVNITSSDKKEGLAHAVQNSPNWTNFCYERNYSSTGYSEYTKVSFNFTIPANSQMETIYLAIFNNSSTNLVYVDDLVCMDNTAAASTAIMFKDENGDVVDMPNEAGVEVVKNFDGTATASVQHYANDNAYIFDGWYDGDTLVSTDVVYTFKENDYPNGFDLTPVVITRNLISNLAGSFEGFANNTVLSYKNGELEAGALANASEPVNGKWVIAKNNGGYYGYVKEETKVYDIYGNTYTQVTSGSATHAENRYIKVVNTGIAYSGNNMLSLGLSHGTGVMAMDVEPNTDYVLSYYIKADAAQVLKISSVVSTINIGSGANVTADNPENADIAAKLSNIPLAFSPDVISLAKKSNVNVDESWQKITLNFNSGKLNRVYLVFSPTAGESYYVDNLNLSEAITSYEGTAIRAQEGEKPQALRYKFNISSDLINNGIGGYEVEEYGSIVAKTANLNGAELTIDGVYANGKKATKGVAYNKTQGINIKFAEDVDAGIVQFTAALTGIGNNKETNLVNYDAWDNNYSVRNYIILKKGDREIVIYGDVTAVASVFAVMDAILSSNKAEDKAIVNNILADETILAAYEKAGYSL